MKWFENIYNIGLPIDLRDWKKGKDIIVELRSKGVRVSDDGRQFRNHIEKYNEGFLNHTQSTYIAHSTSKGYIVTQDKELIKESLQDNYKRAMDMLKKHYRGMKAIDENYTLRIDLDREEMW